MRGHYAPECRTFSLNLHRWTENADPDDARHTGSFGDDKQAETGATLRLLLQERSLQILLEQFRRTQKED